MGDKFKTGIQGSNGFNRPSDRFMINHLRQAIREAFFKKVRKPIRSNRKGGNVFYALRYGMEIMTGKPLREMFFG